MLAGQGCLRREPDASGEPAASDGALQRAGELLGSCRLWLAAGHGDDARAALPAEGQAGRVQSGERLPDGADADAQLGREGRGRRQVAARGIGAGVEAAADLRRHAIEGAAGRGRHVARPPFASTLARQPYDSPREPT